MNIFGDESGKFRVHGKATGINNYECIAGLIVADSLLEELEKRYGQHKKIDLRQKFAPEIIKFLVENKAKAFVIVYDADLCTKEIVQKMRDDYIKSIYERKDHPKWMLDSVDHHANILKKCSLEEFIKALFTIKLLENILRGIVGQSNQFNIHDLKSFPIIFDNMTPALVPTIKYFVSFALFCYAAEKPLDLDNPHNVAHLIHSEGKYFNGKEFFKNINFSKSEDCLGVRIVDVIANQIHILFKDNPLNCDLSHLSKLFSSPYSLSFAHLNLDHEFIDAKVNSNVMQWAKGLPHQINL